MASSNESALAYFIANEIDSKGEHSKEYKPEEIITHVLVDFETALLTKILLSDSSNNSILEDTKEIAIDIIEDIIDKVAEKEGVIKEGEHIDVEKCSAFSLRDIIKWIMCYFVSPKQNVSISKTI